MAEREVPIDELVDSLLDDERIFVAERDSRKQISIRLHHDLLPMLQYRGVIEYEVDREVVRYRSDAEIESVLDLLQQHGQENTGHLSI